MEARHGDGRSDEHVEQRRHHDFFTHPEKAKILPPFLPGPPKRCIHPKGCWPCLAKRFRSSALARELCARHEHPPI